MKSACIHEVFKGFSDTLNKSHYQNNSDAEIPTVVVPDFLRMCRPNVYMITCTCGSWKSSPVYIHSLKLEVGSWKWEVGSLPFTVEDGGPYGLPYDGVADRHPPPCLLDLLHVRKRQF